ncbi:Uncharacterised protein [uncultured archaeon]|nr:Uncharacterised protein [uncultured archaeon]
MEIAKNVARSGFIGFLMDNPIIALGIGVVAIILSIVGLAILSTMHLLTGLIICFPLVVIVFAIIKTGAMPLQKYPFMGIMLGLIPFLGLLAGIAMDYSNMFVLTPMLDHTASLNAYYAGGSSEWIQTNPEAIIVTIVAIAMLAILLFKGKR